MMFVVYLLQNDNVQLKSLHNTEQEARSCLLELAQGWAEHKKTKLIKHLFEIDNSAFYYLLTSDDNVCIYIKKEQHGWLYTNSSNVKLAEFGVLKAPSTEDNTDSIVSPRKNLPSRLSLMDDLKQALQDRRTRIIEHTP